MKVPAVVLAVLLLVATCSPAEARLGDSSFAASTRKTDTIPTMCCFSYRHRPIPRRTIASTYTTSSICPLPAVVLVTKTGLNVCADPQASWVKEYVKHFQMQRH
ncbi:C-C motif chemokine 5-like [Chroicocephalus ridibundus]|uniref:C-C motif chemokine 5-like n=1 Tax=Chroicocephalus ridibundus TaxID=1192867 RepID=UPI002FDDC9B5